MIAGSPELLVTTYRKGVLSRLGHDLRLSVCRFELALEGSRLRGRFEVRSLRVVGSVDRGRLDGHVPGASDRAEIERVASRLLRADEQPQALLEGSVKGWPNQRVRFDGELRLAGVAVPLSCDAVLRPDGITCSFELTPSRWGITPYRAFGGALRLDDRATIDVSLPVVGLDASRWDSASLTWTRDPAG